MILCYFFYNQKYPVIENSDDKIFACEKEHKKDANGKIWNKKEIIHHTV